MRVFVEPVTSTCQTEIQSILILQLIGSILLNIYAEFLARQDSIGDKRDAWACGILCTLAAFPSTPLATPPKNKLTFLLVFFVLKNQIIGDDLFQISLFGFGFSKIFQSK